MRNQTYHGGHGEYPSCLLRVLRVLRGEKSTQRRKQLLGVAVVNLLQHFVGEFQAEGRAPGSPRVDQIIVGLERSEVTLIHGLADGRVGAEKDPILVFDGEL